MLSNRQSVILAWDYQRPNNILVNEEQFMALLHTNVLAEKQFLLSTAMNAYGCITADKVTLNSNEGSSGIMLNEILLS